MFAYFEILVPARRVGLIKSLPTRGRGGKGREFHLPLSGLSPLEKRLQKEAVMDEKAHKKEIQSIQRLMAFLALTGEETTNLEKLLKLSRIHRFKSGAVIIREGDEDPWIYFLLNGCVKISRKGVELNTIDRRGEIFGEMQMVDGENRSATVTAVTNTTCLAVDTTQSRQFPAKDEKDQRINLLLFLYRIIAEYMSGRLRIRTEELAESRLEADRLKKENQELKDRLELLEKNR